MLTLSKRHHKLKWYIYSYAGRKLTPGEMIAERVHFNFIKHALMPLDNTMCFTCCAPAVHRHHVIPLCRGGASTVRNLVPLCEQCHRRYDLIAHKEKRIKREAPLAQQERERARRRTFRTGSLSSFSGVRWKPQVDK